MIKLRHRQWPVMLIFLFTGGASIAQTTQATAPTARPKVVFSEYKCTSRTEKQLLSMIAGCVRVDTAYAKVEPYFNTGLGDYFTLRCIKCSTNSGPTLMEFPKNRDIKTTDKAIILETVMGTKKAPDNNTDWLKKELEQTISGPSFTHQDVKVLEHDLLDLQGNKCAIGRQMSESCLSALGSTPYVVFLHFNDYELQTAIGGIRNQTMGKLTYSMNMIDVKSGKLVAMQNASATGMVDNSPRWPGASSEIVKKTTKGLESFLERYDEATTMSSFSQVDLDISILDSKDRKLLQDSVNNLQVVVQAIPANKKGADILQLRVASSVQFLTDQLNQFLPGRYTAQQIQGLPEISIRKQFSAKQ